MQALDAQKMRLGLLRKMKPGPVKDTIESGAHVGPASVGGIGAAGHAIAIGRQISSRIAAADGNIYFCK